MTPITETGCRRSGKPLPRDHFKDYPTITPNRRTEVLISRREYYLALVDVDNITTRPWMRSAFSTFYDSLSIYLKGLQEPQELINSLRFRELSYVYFSSTVLDEERSRLLKQQLTNEWTGKWTAEELVEGINKMPLPDKKEKIPFLKMSRNAIVDHSREYYICHRKRWNHLSNGDRVIGLQKH